MHNAPCLKVACSVENCDYNKEKMCHASSLEVNITGSSPAHSSAGTECATFKDMK